MMAVNPLLLDFPDQFETERLLIRAPHPGDGRMLNAAIIESLDALLPWMPWAHAPQSPDDSEGYARRCAAQWLQREELPLLLLHRDTGAFVGASGLVRIHWDVPLMEIGYWVATPFAGAGYVTEAVIGITGFAFEHLQAERLEIRCDSRNTRSAAVAERAGYRLEATLRRQMRDVQGNLRDTLVYARLRGE
jgi:RimJ/RimL family protein N-acetyltransferase